MKWLLRLVVAAAVIAATLYLFGCSSSSSGALHDAGDVDDGRGFVGLFDRDAGDVDASDAGELEHDASSHDAGDVDASDAGELEHDASSHDAGDVDASDAGELEPDASAPAYCDGERAEHCDDCDEVCEWLGMLVCCGDPSFPGADEPCECAP